MKKLPALTAAAATLLFAGAANAAMYIVTDANGQQYVVSDGNTRTPLLMGTVVAPPANCQAGFYYQAGNNRVMSCGGGPAMMMAPVPPGTLMATGQPYPAGTLLMQSTAGAVKETGTNKHAEAPDITGSIGASPGPDEGQGEGNGEAN